MIILLDRNNLREEYKNKPAEEVSLHGTTPRMFFLKMKTIINADIICFYCNVEKRWFVFKNRRGGTGEFSPENIWTLLQTQITNVL